MVLAALTSVIWGLGFAAGKLALESFSPAQLTAARFLIACLPVLLVPRPAIAWSSIALIGSTLFTGQFLFMFFAFDHGLPPGVASVSQQMQAFFTVLLGALFLRDVPTSRQGIGMAMAFAGLVPPVPAMLVSRVTDGHVDLWSAFLHASWTSLGAVVYLGALATVVAYATWGYLLQRYPTGVVAPFALLSPCVGVLSSALIFGEVPSPIRYAGMALILGGLVVVVLPADRLRSLRARV
jgi:O-acetylserine/cysteine efflux transporter